MISFTLPIDPVAKGRPRFSRQGHAFTPMKTRRFETDIILLSNKYKPLKPICGPISLSVKFYFAAPKRPKHKEHIVRPDLDNLIKGIKDAFNKRFWLDDSQVNEMHIRKMYDYTNKQPRIEIEIGEN